MKRYLLLFLLIFIVTSQSNAQFGNEWIDYTLTHQYIKFPIVKDGVYKFDSTTLANIGFPLNSINPNQFQLFARGTEVPMYITGNGDGILNANDRIEFYATKNRGELDTSLYITKGGNPKYSLFNDTIYYFLTWNNLSIQGLRYTEQNINAKPIIINNYWYQKNSFVFGDNYYGGSTTDRATNYGYFAEEGFMSNATTNTNPSGIQLNFTVNNPYNLANGTLQTVFITSDNYSAPGPDHKPKISFNGNTLYDTLVDGYNYFAKSFTLAGTAINTSNQLIYKSENIGTLNSGRLAIAFAEIFTPRLTHANNRGNYSFQLNNGIGNISLAISNQGGDKLKTNFLNLASKQHINPFVQSDTVYVTVNSLNTISQNFISYNTDSVSLINNASLVNNTGYFNDYTANIATSKMIIITHPKLISSAIIYANYKTSIGLPTAVVNIEELYEQFSFGIPKHTLSISNFARFAKGVSTTNTNLFLLGKSIISAQARSGSNYNQNLVPTFGYPPSDVLLTANKNSSNPALPLLHTGRLAAQTPSDVTTYLNKVMDYETNRTIANKFSDGGEWMKRILHFAGGYSQFEADELKGFLDDYKEIIEDTLYGGAVKTYSKNTNAPIGAVSDTVKKDINNGVSMMTFFGHASGAGFDQDIDKPSAYNNINGKYPLIIGNSCYAGDIHNPSTPSSYGISEDWVLNNKGAIGFLAESSLGYRYELSEYTSELYRNISYKNYGKSLGSSINNVIQLYGNTTNILLTNTCVGMQYHGDPSIIINSPELPDLALRNTDVKLPNTVTVTQDSFNITLTALNLGRGLNTPVSVSIEHYYQNESEPDTIYEKIIPQGLLYKQDLTIGIKLKTTKAVGLNSFVVKIDPLDNYNPEISETNNTINLNVNVLNSDVYTLWPNEFDIVGENKITLKAATGNLLAPEATYLFECDTTDLFNSPIKQTATVISKGGVINWNINNITLQDTTVYFWRIALAGGSTIKWSESSFEYIPQINGFAQAQYFQFKKNKFELIDYNRPQRSFDFQTQPVKLICTTYGNANSLQQFAETRYQIDTDVKEYGGCGGIPQIQVVVIDSNTIKPWGTFYAGQNPGNSFGNYNDNGAGCRDRVENAFSYYATDSTQLAGVASLLNAVPNGFHILIYTVKFGNFSKWPLALKNQLLNMGATNINNLPDNYPYIFYTRKGNISSAQEVLAFNPTDKLVLNTPMINNWYQGEMTTNFIGPASVWNVAKWNFKRKENNLNDELKIQILTSDRLGNDSILIDNINGNFLSYSLSAIDANKFPFLKLRGILKDSLTKTPPQLQNWRIYYTPIPEAIINPSAGLNYPTQNIDEGDSIKINFNVTNVSQVSMDSLLIRYWYQTPNSTVKQVFTNQTNTYAYIRYDSLKQNTTAQYQVAFSSINKTDATQLWIEINPINDQQELFKYNNLLNLPLKIKPERVNPLQDITFDGVHILNGEIVSPSPNIVIELKDENKFLLLNDTSLLNVSLRNPNQQIFTPLHFGQQMGYQMDFVPAKTSSNEAQILLNPDKLIDGIYTLKSQLVDKSGNKSGVVPIEIDFEVINKSTITNILNYPNPFSTATKFVFTLTGDQIPDVFFIEIMTITGKIVKTIPMQELGSIRIGKNISSQAWDARDNFGDLLANGLYLYRVVAKINGENIELKSTRADNYFKKGWGKLYITR